MNVCVNDRVVVFMCVNDGRDKPPTRTNARLLQHELDKIEVELKTALERLSAHRTLFIVGLSGHFVLFAAWRISRLIFLKAAMLYHVVSLSVRS